jgi:hypothetical protein|tara:strand:- start:18316 stop:18492 length:177 start_codon:yes stop_codon:yes gene_type:complete
MTNLRPFLKVFKNKTLNNSCHSPSEMKKYLLFAAWILFVNVAYYFYKIQELLGYLLAR